MSFKSQETCSAALKMCSLEKLPDFLGKLEPVIGKAGGRKFAMQSNSGTVSLNEIVKRLDASWKDLSKDGDTLDSKSLDALLDSVTQIRDIDQEAKLLLQKKNILVRLLTATKSFFGNLGFNRNNTLTALEKDSKQSKVLHTSENSSEQPPLNILVVEALTVSPDHSSQKKFQAEALTQALKDVTSKNFDKKRKLVLDSPDDVICLALRLSPDNDTASRFIGIMGDEKFESVLRTAAQEERDSNNYETFSLLLSRSAMFCSPEVIEEVIRLATNESNDSIDTLQSQLNKHLEGSTMKNIYEVLVNKARVS